ncbi:hypothetical protein FUAX_52140 (plasmid) [Fulvitalea axinellae]|uniref:Uncharacterized protein n=1 Tax=Fulvitalea axinellae TaxID=1182444 RepID=A0AAU9D0V4_9BACT|nr:hypothetical protein FUAX_52140 [Fulvitalea axinellae]
MSPCFASIFVFPILNDELIISRFWRQKINDAYENADLAGDVQGLQDS